MPQTCSICTHADRRQINAALASEQSLRTIADHFGVSKTALLRHKEHLKQTVHLLEQEQEDQQEATSQGALDVRRRLLHDARLIDEAFALVWNEKAKDVDLLLRVLTESRQQNKLAADWLRDTAVEQMQVRLNELEQKMSELYRARSA